MAKKHKKTNTEQTAHNYHLPPDNAIELFRVRMANDRIIIQEYQENRKYKTVAPEAVLIQELDKIEPVINNIEQQFQQLNDVLSDPNYGTYLHTLNKKLEQDRQQSNREYHQLFREQLKDEMILKTHMLQAMLAYEKLLSQLLSDEFYNELNKVKDPHDFDTKKTNYERVAANIDLLIPIMENMREVYRKPENLSALQKLVAATKAADDAIHQQEKDYKNYKSSQIGLAWGMSIFTTVSVIGLIMGVVGIGLVFTGNPIGLPLLVAGALIAGPMIVIGMAGASIGSGPSKPKPVIQANAFGPALEKVHKTINSIKNKIFINKHDKPTPAMSTKAGIQKSSSTLFSTGNNAGAKAEEKPKSKAHKKHK